MTDDQAKDSIIKNLERERDALRETLRDRFAMAALTGWIACPETSGMFDGAARECYQYADAMMEARKK